MKIHVPNITEEGLELSFLRDGKWLKELLPQGETGRFSMGQANVFCRVRKVMDSILVEGDIDTEIETDCSLCLEKALIPVKNRFRYTLIPRRESVREEKELTAEDMEVEFYDEETIDLAPIILEQIVLQIPMRVLCRDNCRGLCPQCGTNLNTSSCSCGEKKFDERLGALKNLKLKFM
ncbi:MAG: DUF177 domain-containing protein [Syntrophales bacterium]|nr:DUF177 domain-containing protein [Syntrophales bacterium]